MKLYLKYHAHIYAESASYTLEFSFYDQKNTTFVTGHKPHLVINSSSTKNFQNYLFRSIII